VIFVFIFHKVV